MLDAGSTAPSVPLIAGERTELRLFQILSRAEIYNDDDDDYTGDFPVFH